jgi:DeoR/GlpR family transcriptional regulator of sugar metabolism
MYNIKKAFLSAKALDIDKGIMDSNEGEALVKRAMLENASDITLLVDHTKFSKMAHITVCPADRINRIITSTLTDPSIIGQFRNAGIDVVTVHFPS